MAWAWFKENILGITVPQAVDPVEARLDEQSRLPDVLQPGIPMSSITATRIAEGKALEAELTANLPTLQRLAHERRLGVSETPPPFASGKDLTGQE